MRRLLAIVALALLAGCESVPSLVFVHGLDGSLDDGSDDGAGMSDGDDAPFDGGTGCPDTGPIQTFCCGTVPCSGDCNRANCDKCQQQCFPNQICCPINPGRVDCNVGRGC